MLFWSCHSCSCKQKRKKYPEVVTVLQREGSRDSEGEKENLKRGEGSGSGNGSSVGVVTGEAKGHGETTNIERLLHRKGNLSRKDGGRNRILF